MLKRTAGGFTLIEILVVVAVIGLLATVLAPEVIQRMGQGQAAAIQSQVVTLSDALYAHREDVGRFPYTLGQLAVAPPPGSRDSCNRPYAGTLFDNWEGPYVSRELPASGIPVGTSLVRDTLERTPSSYSETGTLAILVYAVDQEVAERIEAAVDGNANFAAGTVRWAATGSGQGTLRYSILVRGC